MEKGLVKSLVSMATSTCTHTYSLYPGDVPDLLDL